MVNYSRRVNGNVGVSINNKEKARWVVRVKILFSNAKTVEPMRKGVGIKTVYADSASVCTATFTKNRGRGAAAIGCHVDSE